MKIKKSFIVLTIIFAAATFSTCGGGSADTPKPSGLTLNRSSLNLLIGNSFQLISSKPDVSWSSGDSSIAGVIADGTVTGIKEGTVKITATTGDNQYTAECTVSVVSKPVAVTGVTINMTSAEITVDGTVDLNETVSPSDATNPAVTWTSSNTYAAAVDTNGVVTGINTGNAVITVNTVDGGKTAKCNITVKTKPTPVTGISLDRSSASVLTGVAMQLKYTITPANATNKNVTWASSDINIAEVTSTGLVSGKKTGEAEISVITDDGNIKAICTVSSDDRPAITAGSYSRVTSSYSCYWINTTIYDLPFPSGYNGYAWNAAVENGNIYVTGRYENVLWGVIAPCYWKNNDLHVLPKPSGSAFEGSVVFIKLYNGSIYHGGAYVNIASNLIYGAYWVNDVRHELPMPAGYEIGTIREFDMLENGKVLSISQIYNPTDGKTKLCYWLDEEYHELSLPAGAVNISFKSHSIADNNVYLTAQYQIFAGPNTYNYTSYWINDTPYDLTTADSTNAGKSSMQIIDGKVYICGQYTESGSVKYCVWSDKIRTNLPVPVSAENVKTDLIAVSGGSVYVSGSYQLSSLKVPCYWIGSTRYDLTPKDYNFNLALTGMIVSGGTINTVYDHIASYWTDTTENILTMPDDFQSFNYLTFMGMQNADIYIMGYYENTSNRDTACYWINNTRYDFEQKSYIESSGTFLSDSAMYNFGRFTSESSSSGCYWINTTRYNLEKFKVTDSIYNEYMMRP